MLIIFVVFVIVDETSVVPMSREGRFIDDVEKQRLNEARTERARSYARRSLAPVVVKFKERFRSPPSAQG